MISELALKAFLSCSLREEDRRFNDFVARMAWCCGFMPCATVGRYVAAPVPLWQQMQDGIRETDCILVAATPRYVQQDVADKNRTKKGISEMLHVESSIAIALGKPVLVFARPGVDLGPFIPSVTQYLVVDETSRADVEAKWPLIQNYFANARRLILAQQQQERSAQVTQAVTVGLAFLGAAAAVDLLFSDGD